MRRFRDYISVVTLCALSAVIPVGCDNRETILVIEKPTEVHSIEQTAPAPESSSAGPQPGKVIAILKASETARAIGVYHGKDFDAFQVKLADGTEGLIIAGDTFKVVSR
ncbi:MAG: hypothetical protein H8K03_05600 [Nitrospira sp.]|nr:hypothetical protein [Nitrospira sp. BO4]